MSKAWAKGSTYKWRKLRKQILDANEINNAGMCNQRIPGTCTGIADTVHHTLGKAITGDDPAYLEAVCKACNLKIGDPTKHNDIGGIPHEHWR